MTESVAECAAPWHGWPPQVWNGKSWVYIEPAKLLVEQASELKRLQWLVDLRSGAHGP